MVKHGNEREREREIGEGIMPIIANFNDIYFRSAHCQNWNRNQVAEAVRKYINSISKEMLRKVFL